MQSNLIQSHCRDRGGECFTLISKLTRVAFCDIIRLDTSAKPEKGGDLMIEKNSGFEIKSDNLFLKIGIVASFMACIGVYFFVPIFLEPISSPMDIFGMAFLGLWLLVVLSGAIISFYRYSRRLIIDNSGVTYKSIFGKQQYNWAEIKDWGLVYDGRTQYGQNCYIVYFANERQKDKNADKKILSTSVLRAHILSEDYRYLTQIVIPFCRRMTTVVPFIPEDNFHWI